MLRFVSGYRRGISLRREECAGTGGRGCIARHSVCASWCAQGARVLQYLLSLDIVYFLLCVILEFAPKVVLTDYPDPSLLDNISYNVAETIPQERRSCVSVQGYIWGRDPTSLIDALRGPDEEDGTDKHQFDLLILSDLIFNHAAVRATSRSSGDFWL